MLRRKIGAAAAHEGDRVDVDEESGGAKLWRGFRVKDMSGAERELRAVQTRRILMQEEAQVRGRGV
jgi:hypothetical protein